MDFFLAPQLLRGLKSVANAQLPSGCWPQGVSISYVSSGDVVQQPSVSVALLLADSIVRPRLLVDHNRQQKELLEAVLPALHKMSKYLAATFVKVGKTSYTGWSSDRTPNTDSCETWITAMVFRLFYRLWLCEKALIRKIKGRGPAFQSSSVIIP